jgi:hypothetical protein
MGLWAEIRRLAEIEKLSARVSTRRLHCSWRTVARVLAQNQPPARQVHSRASHLNHYKAKIGSMLTKCPELSAVRIHEEIARGPDGYNGIVITVRRYVQSIRPASGRVYQEVHYEPAQAMQDNEVANWSYADLPKVFRPDTTARTFVVRTVSELQSALGMPNDAMIFVESSHGPLRRSRRSYQQQQQGRRSRLRASRPATPRKPAPSPLESVPGTYRVPPSYPSFPL